MKDLPTIARIREVAESLRPHVQHTPVVQYVGTPIPGMPTAEVFVKLELLQTTGSFKARGALNSVLSSSDLSSGVTAFSAGNHAIAIAFAAHKAGVSAKVVMPRYANPFRIERCKAWGAEVIFGDDIAALLGIVEGLQRDENRLLIHPFEGESIVEGTATVGLELCDDLENIDVVIVPVGGGGLISGVASAVKQMQPGCQVIGVEPVNASGMAQSLAAGHALDTVKVDTIADSLGAPMHKPRSFSIVQSCVDELVQVTDDQLRDAMRSMFTQMKLAVEPACAASLAALNGPLQSRFDGKRVALIACGSNIDIDSWQSLLA